MTRSVEIALIGAGLIGKRHLASINKCDDSTLVAVVDPDPQAKKIAEENSVPWYKSSADMFNDMTPEGAIVSTPSPLHVENGLECVEAKCPMLVEKPLATTAEEAGVLVQAAREANVPLLVGHHRRLNPLVQKAKEIVESGQLGQLRAIHVNFWLYKPDDYFEEGPWRKKKDNGPISVNLVHDIDTLRYVCGEVASVQAQTVQSLRGFENEDLGAAILRMENGALCTVSLSDTVVAPWSWELTASENPVYPPTSQSCYLLGGTNASLSMPDLTLWSHSTFRSWWEPISAQSIPHEFFDPLILQIRNLANVIKGVASPVVPGEEGYKTLRVIQAIQQSAETGQLIEL